MKSDITPPRTLGEALDTLQPLFPEAVAQCRARMFDAQGNFIRALLVEDFNHVDAQPSKGDK